MSQITRCPACGTMFKVVTDQLKVSQGWVRCGHCTEVFDASLNFRTVQNPMPDISPFSGIDADVKPPVESSVSVAQSLTLEEAPLPVVQHIADKAVSNSVDAVDAVDADIEMFESAQNAPAGPVSGLPDSVPEALAEPLPDEDVSFVRDFRRQAFWRRPVVRFSMGLSGLLLAALLLVQFLVQQRDRLAAMQPELTPWLQRLCEPLQCKIAPLRHIEAVVIDSSSFNKINSDSYRLSFILKNTGTTPVAMPSLEVSLTDIHEQAVIRRVMMPVQFGVTDSAVLLGAGADFSGVMVMQVLGTDALNATALTSLPDAPLRVAGYRLLAFYP